ncbi:hypothetical protein GQ54DRAFT_331631 [Martensiomyces pterosporus]|nr:hypothetical protein GQ54DRAFT_331631 [Martensiomyces pterosporus]
MHPKAILASIALLQAPLLISASCNFADVKLSTNPGFTISVNGDYKILEDTSAKVKYGLFCDAKPSNVDGVDKWFKVPVSSVGTRIPIASGFLEALSLRNNLTAVAENLTLTNPCLNTGNMAILNSTSDNSTNVDVIFSSNATSDGEKSVRLPSDDSLSPLQLAEWIKFVAAFFNVEINASKLFDSISTAYSCLNGNMQNVKQRPHAYWVQYTNTTNGGHAYNIIESAYQKSLLASASATNNTNKLPDDSADQGKFQDAVKDAQFVIDQTDLKRMGMRVKEWQEDFGYTDAPNSGVPFLTSMNIWRTDGYNSKNGVSNFPEFGLVRPDLVLRDLISILEPTYDSTYNRTWMWRLGSGSESTTNIGASNYDCSNPWITTVTKCSPRSDFYGGEFSTDGSDSSGNDQNEEGKSSDKSKSKSSSKGGKIAGGVVAAVVLIGLGFVGLHYYNRNRRQARMRALSQTEHGEDIGLQSTNRFR